MNRHSHAPSSILDILQAIADGRSDPDREIAAAFDRIAATDGEIKAFTRVADRATVKAASGPLAGIAFAVKDIFDTRDMPTEHGSAIYRDHRPVADSAVVAMARAAGATVIGKATTTEFASMDPTVTRNPHNLGHTPGGSSAGSAAAVAAGMVPLACGSQTGGSVIRPASFCGVAGFKPSFRLLPTVGMKTFAYTLDTPGLFAASVADVAFAGEALARRPLAVDGRTEASGLTVGLYRSHIDNRLDPEMRAAWEEAARFLERAGARLVDVEEPAALAAARDAHGTIQGFEASLALADEYRTHRSLLGPKVAAILDEAAQVEPASYDDARRVARIGRKAASALFETADVLLAPSALGPAPESLESTGDPLMNKLWTLTGNPVVNVPGLAASNGLPLGLSIIARFGRDARALAVASALEALIRAA
ncbi:amidase [Jiella marina]|uniref:amidase n=1 Tax=Jiella sp. LLJ827 TaxID=2917712 RepID=UPI002101D061|nr:amidase [Jiella sp. LLJ827]MCQ0988309.1 amidase [Jiella sp. LLJ827]